MPSECSLVPGQTPPSTRKGSGDFRQKAWSNWRSMKEFQRTSQIQECVISYIFVIPCAMCSAQLYTIIKYVPQLHSVLCWAKSLAALSGVVLVSRLDSTPDWAGSVRGYTQLCSLSRVWLPYILKKNQQCALGMFVRGNESWSTWMIVDKIQSTVNCVAS